MSNTSEISSSNSTCRGKEELFKQPPPKDDCPICDYRLPILETGHRYKTCCGKTICSGCVYAPVYDNQGNVVAEKKCAFCRASVPKTDEEVREKEKERMEADDPIAIFNRGCDYRDGTYGFEQDFTNALELWHRAAELGDAYAYGCIGYAYMNGEGVEVDKKKAIHYWELAAMGEDAEARFNLGLNEARVGDMDRAIKHFMIAVRSGYNNSLEKIQELYIYGYATKEDYTKALRLYQEYLGEIKSKRRDEAAAADEENRYY